jgi:hypothetical protein
MHSGEPGKGLKSNVARGLANVMSAPKIARVARLPDMAAAAGHFAGA